MDIKFLIFGGFRSTAPCGVITKLRHKALRTKEHVNLSLHLKKLVLHILFLLLELMEDGD
jgi:hypothetical protein